MSAPGHARVVVCLCVHGKNKEKKIFTSQSISFTTCHTETEDNVQCSRARALQALFCHFPSTAGPRIRLVHPPGSLAGRLSVTRLTNGPRPTFTGRSTHTHIVKEMKNEEEGEKKKPETQVNGGRAYSCTIKPAAELCCCTVENHQKLCVVNEPHARAHTNAPHRGIHRNQLPDPSTVTRPPQPCLYTTHHVSVPSCVRPHPSVQSLTHSPPPPTAPPTHQCGFMHARRWDPPPKKGPMSMPSRPPCSLVHPQPTNKRDTNVITHIHTVLYPQAGGT